MISQWMSGNTYASSGLPVISSKNKVNRQHLEMNHANGRSSFAQIEVDEVAKSGKILSQVDIDVMIRREVEEARRRAKLAEMRAEATEGRAGAAEGRAGQLRELN
ncbi:hypothetical protein Cni_G12319 [Canna indica]|uniref:Uncharacterized protein n=1 Tax=Canna indica TaxID=4628 RepID=A0AAQ3QAG3_9LILI|nr:hypothetical protein Cni_G12319 [Canna indica]